MRLFSRKKKATEEDNKLSIIIFYGYKIIFEYKDSIIPRCSEKIYIPSIGFYKVEDVKYIISSDKKVREVLISTILC